LFLRSKPCPESQSKESTVTRGFAASFRFGAHADFINGWDQEELAKLVAGRNY